MSKAWEMQRQWMIKWRKLLKAFIASCIFNVALLLVLVVRALQFSTPPYHDFSPHYLEKVDEGFKEKVIPYTFSFSKMTYARLVEALNNSQIIHEEFRVKDLALSYLFSFYDFNLYKALGTEKVHKKKLPLGISDANESLILIMNLSPVEDKKIVQYLQQEKWPFTPEGLFKRIKLKWYQEESLKQAFFNTQEFYLIYTLLARQSSALKKEEVLQLMLEGQWELVEEFYHSQKKAQDLSKTQWRKLLLDYVAIGSGKASELIVERDTDYLLQYFEEKHLRVIVSQLDPENASTQFFMKKLQERESPSSHISQDIGKGD